MSGERQIEMTWRCSSCRQQNLGRHVLCQACGSPKDDSEEYEMPTDTANAATVTDAALLQLAHAGANWRCRYCGSDQRTLEGTCGQCGSKQVEGRSTAEVAPQLSQPFPTPRRRLPGDWLTVLAPAALLVVLVSCLFGWSLSRGSSSSRARLAAGATALSPPFRDETASVTGVRWKQVVSVERWQVLRGEGFEEAKPADAFEVRPAGKRFHHTERVLSGYDSQSYTETEPDGFRTESYTEEEPCGQDCSTRPQSCSEKCTPNKNGFATCKTVCTGGGQDCRTKYCSVNKTRQIPKTKIVTKTRQVPRYADVPRDATWYAWKVWGWRVARTLEKSGTTTRTEWPTEAEVQLGKGLAAGERERQSRSGQYAVDLLCAGTRRELSLGTPEALASYAPGTKRKVRAWTSGRVEAL